MAAFQPVQVDDNDTSVPYTQEGSEYIPERSDPPAYGEMPPNADYTSQPPTAYRPAPPTPATPGFVTPQPMEQHHSFDPSQYEPPMPPNGYQPPSRLSTQPYTQTQMTQQKTTKTTLGVPHNIEAIIAYVFLLGSIIVAVVEKKNEFAAFHGWQGLFVNIPCFVIAVVFSWNVYAWLAVTLVWLIIIVGLCVKAWMDAETQKLFKLPIIGDFAAKIARGRTAPYIVAH
mmetsp:Transcript_27122/g.30234  ORF Transcript_27122/g.30234 Transcript_27122/m.30234 type:complete len:228 (-) Transcript_27122:136-819(-)